MHRKILPVLLSVLFLFQNGCALANQEIGRKLGTENSLTKESPAIDISITEENSASEEPPKQVALSKALTSSRAAEILAGLRPLAESGENKFVIPEDSLVKPQIHGTQVMEEFPPKETKATRTAISKPRADSFKTPLSVTRVSPEGAQDEVAQIAVTFSQPMVPIGKMETVEPGKFVTMSPQPSGSWRWAGSQALLFDPQGGRLPKSTNYNLSVSTAVVSENGGKLPAAYNWKIGTPTVEVKQFQPTDLWQTKTPVFFAIFDQDVERENLIKHVRLTSRGNSNVFALRLIGEDKLDRSRKEQIKSLPPKQWMAFEPVSQLPLDTEFVVTFGAHLESAEGPLTSKEPKTFKFRTYGPLTFKKSPKEPVNVSEQQSMLMFEFSNPLNAEKFKTDWVTVKPSPKEFKVRTGGCYVILEGTFKSHTKYSVRFDKALIDTFGQTLGSEATGSFTTSDYQLGFNYSPQFITIPGYQKPVYSMLARGTGKFKISIYAAEPTWYDPHFRKIPYELKALNYPLLSQKEYHFDTSETAIDIDLAPYVKDRHGHFVILAEASNPKVIKKPTAMVWVQVTDIGLTGFFAKELVTYATSIKNGSPLSGVDVTLHAVGTKATTDAQGIAKLSVPAYRDSSAFVVAKTKDDAAILPGGWAYQQSKPTLLWYTVSDRNLYRPGELVSCKGWLRGFKYGEKDAVHLFKPHIETVSYELVSSTNDTLCTGQAIVDEFGGFTFSAKLPSKLNLGQAIFRLTASPHQASQGVDILNNSTMSSSLSIQIEEFRRPEFEMKVTSLSGNTAQLGDTAKIQAKANYFAGGALKNSPVNWKIDSQYTHYSPPGWRDYQFSGNSPFVKPQDHARIYQNCKQTLVATSDSRGISSLNLRVNKLSVPMPVLCNCEATVNDLNRQTWSSQTSLVIHPADVYIGLRKLRNFVVKGDDMDIDVIATDIDGKVVEDKFIELTLKRKDQDKGTYVEVEKRKVVSGDKPVRVTVKPTSGGQHILAARTIDSKERPTETYVTAEIADAEPLGGGVRQPSEMLLIADKDQYKSGETAEILVKTRAFPSRGMMILRRASMLSSVPFTLTSAETTLKVPITEDYYPGLNVSVFVAGENGQFAKNAINLSIPPLKRELKLVAQPEQAEVRPGSTSTIKINLRDAEGKPVRDGQVALAVVDDSVLALNGYAWTNPLNVFYPQSAFYFSDFDTQHSIWMTKEMLQKTILEGSDFGLLLHPVSGYRHGGWNGIRDSLSNFAVGDSSGLGYIGRIEGARDVNMFQVEPTVIDERHYTSGRGERHQNTSPSLPGSASPAKTKLRTNFGALALFESAVKTDENGCATVKFDVPDGLARYRIMAVAVAGADRFGSTESNITTKLPLMVKASAPRFLNYGDKCELPVVLQNQTDQALSVEVALRSANASLGADAESVIGRMVSIPPKDRVEVRFPVATVKEGQATFQCAALSGNMSDAAEFSVPVIVPATTETFAAYGEIDSGAVLQKLKTPVDVFSQVGGLQISTSSTAVQALTDAYVYLRDYPFSCSEQISSRLIAALSLENVLTAFGKLNAAEKANFRQKMQDDIDVLEARQNSNGGFGLWTQNDVERWPFLSPQVMQALALAQQKDYRVDQNCLDRGNNYLRRLEHHFPAEYDERTKQSILARTLNVRWLAGDKDVQGARDLFHRIVKKTIPNWSSVKDPGKTNIGALQKEASLESAGWLFPILCKDPSSTKEAALMRRFINSRILETASRASANDGGYGDCDYLMFYSPRRVDAIVLEAFMEDQPQSPLIAKLVRGLLAHRKKGTWNGSQENGYILQALDRYFAAYEKNTPDFEAQSWLDDTLVGLSRFVGRSTETKTVNVPMNYLLRQKKDEILISKKGTGRLYYRVALDYAPKDLKQKPADFGFAVSRTYESVESKDDVWKDSDGNWHIKAGSLVRSKVQFSAPGARYHVALIDPIPAGTEQLNSSLAGNQSLPDDSTIRPLNARGRVRTERHYDWWYRQWYEHQNLRDDKAEAFASLLPAGTYDYSHVMRATTPGDYVVPPCKLQEMYAEETFGRSAAEHVIVE